MTALCSRGHDEQEHCDLSISQAMSIPLIHRQADTYDDFQVPRISRAMLEIFDALHYRDTIEPISNDKFNLGNA